MNLQVLIDNKVLWQSDLVVVSVIGATIFVFLILIVIALWRMLTNNEKLKYEFITIIAHKYRTPLTQVKWLAENLRASETDPYKKESLTNIDQSNDNLIKLTNSLIEVTDNDTAAVASYEFEKTSLCELVRATAEPYKKLFHEKNIFFSVSCGAEDRKCKIDKQRMEFVIQSLLENARTYTQVGKNVEVSVTKSHRKAIISVVDHGIGISKDELPLIFTKFFRSESARRADTEGFGISLFLSKAIIRRHGGKILVSSSGLDKGARFDVILKAVK